MYLNQELVFSVLVGGGSFFLSYSPYLFSLEGIFLSLFSSLPLFLLYLNKGFGPFLVGCFSACIVGCALGPLFHLLSFFLLTLLPCLVLAIAAQRSHSLNEEGFFPIVSYGMVGWLSIFSIFVILSMFFYGDLERIFLPIIKEKIIDNKAFSFDLFPHLIYMLPAFTFFSSIGIALLNFFIGWVACKKKPCNNQPINSFWDIILVIGILLNIMGKFFLSPFFYIFGFAFLLNSLFVLIIIGLTILKDIIRKFAISLSYFYVFLMVCFFLGWPFLIMAIIGFVEPWYDLRNNFQRK